MKKTSINFFYVHNIQLSYFKDKTSHSISVLLYLYAQIKGEELTYFTYFILFLTYF